MSDGRPGVNRKHTQQSWVGKEIEKTKFFMMESLLISCEQSVDDIIRVAKKNNTPHILLRCLQTPDGQPLGADLAGHVLPQALALIQQGFVVTIECRAEDVTDEFVEKCPDPQTPEGQALCIMLSVYFPNAAKIAPYTSLKLYSKFYSENPGVWCLDAEDFIKSAHRTDWPLYDDDRVVDDDLIANEEHS